MQASIDGKVDQSVYDLAMVAVAGQIKGIREDLNTLTTTGQVAQNAADIKTAQEAIATLMAAYENLKLQSNVLQEYKDALDDISENKEAIETAQGDIDEAKGKIEDLWLELVGEDGESGLKGLIKGNADAITNLGTTTGQAIEALENRIDGELNDIRNDIKDNIKPAITAIQDKIRDEIQPELDQLHILVTARLTSISPAPDAYVGGIPEMIIDGESGCLVQSGDSKALAECVEMLCDKDDIRIRYGVNFYERAKENFSSQAMANTHKKIYEKIIKENVK